MGLLQRWLDEPDQSIARMATGFYVLTFVFAAVFAWQMVYLVLQGDRALVVGDVVGPLVSLFLTATMYGLALDGRRSYKAMQAKGQVEPPGLNPYG